MKRHIYAGSIQKTGIIILIVLLLLGSSQAQEPAKPDTFDITSNSIRFPHQLKKWAFQTGIGLVIVKPPMDLLENAIQAPLVNVHVTFGLPWKLSLEGDLSTIFVSNQFSLGPRIGFGHRNFSFNAGWDVAWVYGQLKQGGFNNSTNVWIHYPNISLGYKLKKMAFTLKGEAVVIASLSAKSGENEISRTKNSYNGFTVGFYLEQRLTKNKVLVFGIKDNYEKYYWPTWMIFTTFNRFYHIPELSFMWIL
jgi:hypothetical protein